jgi:hypothetical protein
VDVADHRNPHAPSAQRFERVAHIERERIVSDSTA